jgi:hypothetical protein
MLIANNSRPTRVLPADTVAVARDTALGDRLRFGLTSLGMLMGIAPLMLVTTFSLAGKDYVLHEIRSMGSTGSRPSIRSLKESRTPGAIT